MRLPDDKTERTKVLVLIGIGVVAVLYGLFVGAVAPLKKRSAERTAKLADLNGKIEAADREIARIGREEPKTRAILDEIMALTVNSNFVLHARHGNFLLGATEFVERHATAANLKIRAVEEVGISDLPARKGAKGGHTFRAYTARLQAETGMHVLIEFLRSLEAANPCLCVSDISIASHPGRPAAHDVRIDIQWPVWSDPEQAAELERQWVANHGEGGG